MASCNCASGGLSSHSMQTDDESEAVNPWDDKDDVAVHPGSVIPAAVVIDDLDDFVRFNAGNIYSKATLPSFYECLSDQDACIQARCMHPSSAAMPEIFPPKCRGDWPYHLGNVITKPPPPCWNLSRPHYAKSISSLLCVKKEMLQSRRTPPQNTKEVEALLLAVRCGNVEVARTVLTRNTPTTIDINAAYTVDFAEGGRDQTTLLHIAGSAEVAQLLLSPPLPHLPFIDVNRTTCGQFDEVTPLCRACSEGREDVVRELLGAARVDPNKGWPLWQASRGGCAGMVRLLLGHPRTDVNKASCGNMACVSATTPLAEALIHGHLGVARMIVVRGGAVNEEAQDEVDKAMGGHHKYEQWLIECAHPTVANPAKDKIIIRQLEEEVRALKSKLSTTELTLTELQNHEQRMGIEHAKEKSFLERKHSAEMTAAKNACEESTKRLNQQHLEEINHVNKKLQQVQEQLRKQEESHSMGPTTTLPELNEAFKLATLFQRRLKESAQGLSFLQESLAELTINLQGVTEHNEALASHLKELSELKSTLVNKLSESDAACKKSLGQTLTVQNSEAEIQARSRKISELIKQVFGIKPDSAHVFLSEESDVTVDALLKPLIVHEQPHHAPSTPPFQVLCTLTDTLAQLQAFRFDECTKIADKHTVLSKELSEQETLGGTLHRAVEGTQRECSELQGEHKSKWMLRQGLEGDEQFIGVPCVWSQLSELLPQAQQAMFDLMVSKASSSGRFTLPGFTSSPQQPPLSPVSSGGMMQQMMLCIECDERTPNIQFQPCGHIVLCSQCSPTVRKCPHCRVQITTKLQIQC
ncbi:hypothetical protein Pelo_2676 [Pelomyxa schiedti]|nr:hypothetical protein Pelo_2676 [Pelomyxa schiedti]